jgi:hypothetical protein
MKLAAVICNIVFFGLVCWTMIDQYPHPKEDGFIAFAVLIILTPILNLVVLLLSTVGDGRIGFYTKKNQKKNYLRCLSCSLNVVYNN